MSARDLSGQRFGRLTVEHRVIRDTVKEWWHCACDCGGRKAIRRDHLLTGATQSCGCIRKEVNAVNAALKFTTHGMSQTAIGSVWYAMMQRCYNKNCKKHHLYGGNGIIACELFRAGPPALASIMGERPSRQHTIDRRDNTGSYTCGQCRECLENGWPMNVRWATMTEQNRNRKDNVLITDNGITRCAAEWSDIWGIPVKTLYARIKSGWPAGRLKTPVRAHA